MEIPKSPTTPITPLDETMERLGRIVSGQNHPGQTVTIDPDMDLDEYQPLEKTPLDETMERLDSIVEQSGVETFPREYGLRDILQLSDDPIAAMSRLNASQYMAKALGLDTAFVYQNLDTVSREYWGRVETPQRIVDIWETSYKAGQLSTELNELMYETMNGRGSPEITARMEQIREELPDYQYIYESLPKKMVSDAANMLPFMLRSMGKGAELGPYAALGAVLGAGAALLIAPEATIPALGAAGAAGLLGAKAAMATQFTTVPGLMLAFQGGAMYGSAQYSKKVMAGALYEELDNAVDVNGNPMNLHPDIVRAAVEGIAGVEAAIEMMQLGDIPGIRQIMQELSGVAIRNAITKGLIHGAVGTFVRKWGGSIVSETGEELAQEVVDIIGKEMLLALDAKGKGIEHRVDIEDAISRIGDTFASSVRGFAVIGFPGSLLETGRAAITTRRGTRAAARPEAPQAQGTPSAAGPGLQGTEARQGSQGTEGTQAAQPAPEPLQFARVPVRTKTIAQTDDRTTASVYAGDHDYARISIDHDTGKVTVTDIETQNPEARRAILENIYRDYEGAEIVWEPETREDAALKTAVQQNVTVSRDFISQARKAFNFTEERQITALHSVMTLFAQAKGMNLETYMDSYYVKDFFRRESASQLNQGKAKGGTGFVDEAGLTVPISQIPTTSYVRAFIVATEKADFSTALHEIFHVAERLTLTQAQKNALARAVGKTWDKMTVGDMENLAYGFENYWETGRAPTAELKTLFQQIAEIMSRIFSALRQKAIVSPEMIAFYDSLVSNPDTGAAIAEEAAKKEQVAEPEAAGAVADQAEEDPEKFIVNPIDPSLSREEKVTRLQELSRENEPIIDRIIKRIDAELGTESKFSHKERAKILEKAQRPSILAEKPWHDVEHIRDGFRFKTVIAHFTDVQGAFKILLDEGIGVVKIDTKKMIYPKEWGWRFAGFDLRMPNGQIVEWYLPLKELEDVKDGNHKIFEKWRNLKPEQINNDYDAYERDQEKSRSVYTGAFEAYLKRDGLDLTAAEAAWAKAEASLVSMIGSKESISSSAEGMPRVQTPFLNITEKASHLTQTRPPSGSRETLTPSIPTSTESILLPEPGVNDEVILFQADDPAFHEEATGAYSGQVDLVATLRDKSGALLSYARYADFNGRLHLQMIETKPEYRRQGLANLLLRRIQEENPGKEINWGMLTDDGALLKKAYEESDTILFHIDEIRKQYEGTDQWMKAPNGKPTNLNENQWIQVRTPAFKRWFGDWENDPGNASKVVDENGEPMVVYHGTTSTFDVFSEKKSVKTDRAVSRFFGFFFTGDKEDAQRYAKWNGANGPNMELYLSIQKPYLLENTEHDALNMFVFNKIKEAGYNFTEEDIASWKKKSKKAVKEMRDSMIEKGYDGIFIMSRDGDVAEYVAFYPEQIKSIENRGTFDPENPSILYQEDESFNKKLLAFADGTLGSNVIFDIGKPHGALARFLSELPIQLRQSVLKKAQKEHSIEISALKSLPSMLSRPVFIFSSKDFQSRAVVIETRDGENRNILIALLQKETRPDGKTVLEVNDITSIYGKKEESLLYWIGEDGLLLYADKEKGFDWIERLSGSHSRGASDNQSLIDKVYSQIREKSTISFDTLFQDLEADLLSEALNFKTPEEFRQYIEAMYFEDEITAEAETLSEEEKAAWYKRIWDLARQRKPGSVKGENLTKHVQQPGVLEQFLKKINDAVSMRGFEGFAPEDAEDVQTFEYAAKLQKDINAQVHPLILSNAIRAAKGKPLTESVRKAIVTLISQAEPEYGRIYYRVTGDEAFLRPEAEALAAVDISEPQFDELDRLSITDKYRLAARIKNDEISRKIISGEIVVDTEVEEYIGSLNENIRTLEKEIKDAREELAEDFTKFGKQEQTFIKQRDQIKEKTKEVEKLNRQVAKLVEEGKEVKEKLSRTRQKAEQELRDLKAAFKDTMKSAREEARLQAYTRKEEAIKKLKADIKRKQEEKKAAQEIKEYKLKLAQAIMRQPGMNIFVDYRTQIEEIQRVIDPKFRSAQAIWQWELAGKLLAKGDTETFERIIPESIRKRLEKKPLNLWTIQELEELKSKIDALREAGRLEQSRAEFTVRLRQDDLAGQIQVSTLKGHHLVPKTAIGSVEEEKARKTGLLKSLDMAFVRPLRVFLALDGGKEGVWYNRVWRKINEICDSEITATNARKQRIFDAMKKLHITVKDLARKLESVTIQEMQPDGTWKLVPRTYRVQDAMYFYIGMKNTRTHAAIVYGMGLNEQFVNAMINQLTPEQKQLAETISAELDIAWERLREAFAKDKNLALGKEEYYVPMFRFEETGDDLNATLVDEALTRTAWYNAYPNKGFTQARIDIAPEHQKPIRTDLFGIAMTAIDRQEHYLASWEFVKDIQAVLRNDELERAINQEFGKEYNEWLQKYINNIANPSAGKDLKAIDRLFSTMQRNMGIAYLSYNLTTILKQAPSFLLAVGEVDPHHLATAAARFAANPAAMLKRVAEMDPQIMNRAMDPLFAKLKESEKGIVSQITGTFGRIGMKPIEWVDKAVVTIVWDAAYNHALREGKTLNQARDFAQDVINRTQPASRVKDLPLAYSTGDKAAKLFLVFTNQINQIWNMMRHDIPFAVKAGNLKYLTMKTTAMALSFLAMGAIGNRFEPPEDEKEFFGWILEGMLNAVPLIGKDIVNGMKGFDSGISPVVPMEPAIRAAKQIYSGNIEGAVESAGEAVATGMGVPVTGIKRIARAIQDRDILQILGGKRDKKKKKRKRR